MLKQSTKKQTQKGTGNSPPRKDRTFTTERNRNRNSFFFKWQLSSQGKPKRSKGLGGSAEESGGTPLPDGAVSGGAALAGPGKHLEAATEASAGRERSQKPLPTSLPHYQGFLGIYLLPRHPIPLPLAEHLRRCRAPAAGPSFGQTRSAPGGPAGDRGGSDPHGSGSPHRFPGQPHRFPAGPPAGGGAESALPVSAGRGRGRGRGGRPRGTRGLSHRPRGRGRLPSQLRAPARDRGYGGTSPCHLGMGPVLPRGGFVCDTATAGPASPSPPSCPPSRRNSPAGGEERGGGRVAEPLVAVQQRGAIDLV